MTRFGCFLGIVFLAVLALPASAAGESADSSAAGSSHLVITEVGVATTIQGSRPGLDPVSLGINVGYLQRTGRSTLLGAEFAFDFDGDGSLWAVRPRLRREIDRDWALNVAAGPIVSATKHSRNLDGTGLSVAVGLDYRDYVGMSVDVRSLAYTRPEWLLEPDGDDQRVTTGRIGLRLGKGPGIVAAAGLALVYVAAVSAFAGPFGN